MTAAGIARERTRRHAALLQDLGADPSADPRRVLDAAGDLTRRSRALGVGAEDDAAIDRALSSMSREAALGVVRSTDLVGEAARLAKAMDDAIEIALAEEEAERKRAAGKCAAALEARDRLASRAVALGRWERLHKMELGGGFGDTLADLDRPLRLKARCLVGLNADCRAALEELDPSCREDAWWYSARSACDGLVDALAGGEIDAHVSSCGDCQADLDGSAAASSGPSPHHVTAGELWRYDLDVMSADERRFLDRHADGCPRCAQAMWAYRDGDHAVDEVADPPGGGAGKPGG